MPVDDPGPLLITQAREILEAIEYPFDAMPKAWADRAPKVMLSLAGMTPRSSWVDAKGWGDAGAPLVGSRKLLTYVNDVWGESIGSGSYDDIRRRCVKFLVESGIALKNPDDLARAPNSPATGYALSEAAKSLLTSFGSSSWDQALESYKQHFESLSARFRQERDMNTVPVVLPHGETIQLSPGEHNELQRKIIEDFLPRFAPGAELIYVGDALSRQTYKNEMLIDELNLFELNHEQLPDVIALDRQRNWLLVIEAVVSSGPISPLRKVELERLLEQCTAPPVFVTAFTDNAGFKKFAHDIAWETEVWVADHPTHMIHYNGERYLGPY